MESRSRYALSDCPEIVGDRIDQVLPGTGERREQAGGQPIRLRFVMKDADLYAIRFH